MNLAMTRNSEMGKLEGGGARSRGFYLKWEMLRYICVDDLVERG